MTSQIRVDEITNRSGLGTVTIYDNGFEFTGVSTFTENVDIEGNLTIGGVLTYEDTTNIDSVGVITARGGIRVTGDSIHVESSEDRLLYLKSTDANAYLTFEDTDSSSGFANRVGTVSDGLYFSTGGGGERVRITSDGKIGINEATPDAQLHVRGSGNSSGLTFLSEDSSGNNTFWIQDGGKVGVHYYPFAINRDSTDTIPSSTYFYVHSASPFAIKNDGAVVIGTDTAATNTELTIRATSPHLSLYATPGQDSRLNMGDTDDHDIGMITYANFDNSMRFTTNATERLRITSDGIHKISTAGSTQDGTFFSTLTINNTGSNTYSRVRFDRSGVARFGLTLRNDDKLCISNLYQGGSVSANDAAFVMDAYSKIGINEASPTARLDINHPHTEQGLVVRSRYGNIATAMVKFDGDPDSNGGDGNVLHIHGGSSRTDSEILHIDSTGVGDIFDIRGDGLTRVYKQLQLEHSSNVAAIIFNEYGANDPKAQIEMDQVNGSAGQLIFRTQDSGTLAERLRITSGGDLVYDTNKGGIYNFDKACGSNTSTNIFRIGNDHGAHCFTIYMTCSNSGNSVSKIYNVACQYGASPTINSAADTGGYSANNFSLTGSVSGLQHTFAISVTGAAATISCTVVLGSMNTAATFTKL